MNKRRLGIRAKVLLALLAALVLPLSVGSVAGVGLETAEELKPGASLSLAAALLIPFALCGAVLVSVVSSNVLRPLRELKRAANAMEEGRFDYEIAVRGGGEMDDFRAAFEAMRLRLQESLEAQQALERSRKELIASISHDLRTPLSSIKGYVEALCDGVVRDEERTARYLNVIRVKTESLDLLIENLFQYSQLELDDRPERRVLLDSRELLETILTPLEMEFADGPVALSSVKPFPAVNLEVDAEQIARVLHNLIDNARRHTRERDSGRIRVEAHADGERLAVSVADNGTGIAQEDLPYVFDFFYRAEKSRSRHHGGAGLGLALCKKTIENHGGVIRVSSVPSETTVFTFTLPLAPSPVV
ncbi:HAMP domain-containing sensor histidine kinase [Saccharibacillus sp. CPCC 101409]|uniref:sensor histidine kinase n=1 Tax=Saccharibacillus sp. CPCC 101409 TaxID=3058041 RepID=UPI0026725E3C|nr:HAMP domain-containing sensor histidine kinase [Saccharibacillus sp. CPCC 101409]MDO3411716.1 HAMP domain-containing sensor histidine kinase [Saccharibacillus sp. CPCC 101409]